MKEETREEKTERERKKKRDEIGGIRDQRRIDRETEKRREAKEETKSGD